MKSSPILYLSIFAAFLIIPALTFAQEQLSGPLIPGTTEGIGTYFTINGSEYLNVSIQSSEKMTVILESIPKVISLRIEASTSTNSSILTIRNLEPNKIYYKFQDSYKNKAIFISDSQGNYTWPQDLTQKHHVWFQETDGTVFLPEDCSDYGSWDELNSTCILTQDLTQSIEITENNITLNCDGHKITGLRTGYGVYLNNRSGAVIEKCAVANFSYGIYLYFSPSNTIADNVVKFASGAGIELFYSSNNTLMDNSVLDNLQMGIGLAWSHSNVITNNIASRNMPYGIFLGVSSNNTLTGNEVSNNYFIGLALGWSSNNTLANNILLNNRYNFDVYGTFVNNIDITNKINGKAIQYLIGKEDLIIDSSWDVGYLGVINSTNITIKDLTITNNGQGVLLAYSANSTVENIKTRNNHGGVVLVGASQNILTNNTSSDNAFGINLQDYSFFNTISNNNVSNNQYGIYLVYSSLNTIRGNIVDSNSNRGIQISYRSSGNTAVNNIILNNGLGIYIVGDYLTSNNRTFHNNFIDNISQASVEATGVNNAFDDGYPDGGNYWSNYDTPVEGCNDSNGDGICDTPYTFTGSQDRYPFTEQDGWATPVNQPPTILNLNQYKSDIQTEIAEGGITTESSLTDPARGIVVFKATVTDPDDDSVKFQVELKKYNQSFNELGILESNFIPSGNQVTITATTSLTNGQYKWRARAKDSKGAVSSWQEFGIAENVDFEVKLVPLYTQVFSPYPSEEETRLWFNEYYAGGDIKSYFCGSRIYQCGCAITSVVMIARYYDVIEANGKDVNPGEINKWLKNEPGGYENGDVNWIAAAKYTGWIIKYEKTDKTTNNYTLLDEYLNKSQPVIVKENAGRGGINRQHFLVIDSKLASTYSVKDPAWYNTKTLNEITSTTNHVRGYENGFDGLRIYKKGDGIAQSAITIALGSPAELLITDPQGRKLGKDVNGIEYQEMSNAWYFEDSFDDPTGEIPPSQERNKLIQILEPIDGKYQIQVIGTGEGDYTLVSTGYISDGQSTSQTYEGTTVTDNVQKFELDYSTTTTQEIQLYRITDIDIKPGSDPNSINLRSKGLTPVAILTDEFFDAKDVIMESVIFAGAEALRSNLEDVDKDGDLDLLLHFDTKKLQLASIDTEAILTGTLKDGTLIKGSDFVKIIANPKQVSVFSAFASAVLRILNWIPTQIYASISALINSDN